MATTTPQRPSPQPAQPPDERFWVKYSPHHELPISGMASLAWHTLAVVSIVLVAWVIASTRHDDMPIETVQIGGGGGGNPKGIGDGPGDGRSAAGLVEAASKE